MNKSEYIGFFLMSEMHVDNFGGEMISQHLLLVPFSLAIK